MFKTEAAWSKGHIYLDHTRAIIVMLGTYLARLYFQENYSSEIFMNESSWCKSDKTLKCIVYENISDPYLGHI